MFRSYKCYNIGFTPVSNKFYYRNELIDDNFIETDEYHTFVPINTIGDVWCDTINTTINIYKNRNLNVAANLVKALIYATSQYDTIINNCRINDVIKYCKKNSTEFLKYEKDVEKYLLLI